MQICSSRSAKFNFMQVVHPMLTSFHCVPYLMKFKQRENGPDLLNEMQANGKRTRTLCPSKNPYLLKIEKLSQISTFGEGQYQETSPSSAINFKIDFRPHPPKHIQNWSNSNFSIGQGGGRVKSFSYKIFSQTNLMWWCNQCIKPGNNSSRYFHEKLLTN